MVGVVLPLAVAATATVLGRFVPVAGAPVLALALGVVVITTVPRLGRFGSAVVGAGRWSIQAAVVVLGANLSLHQIAHTGASSLPVLAGTLAVALGGAPLLGRAMGVSGGLRTLIGVGTGICGASAIAATSRVVVVTEAEIAYAVSTIFAFNVAAVLVFPLLGHLLGLSAPGFGLWAGSAVNDTSSVVTVGYAFNATAGDHAVVVKLTRTLAIIPVTIGLALARARAERGPAGPSAAGSSEPSGRPGPTGPAGARSWPFRLVPGFLLLFLCAGLANTVGLVPAVAQAPLSTAAGFLVTVGLAAVGLGTRLHDLRRTGPRPMLFGGLLWAALACTGLAIQAVTGQW
ncbi:putative sulfate exporter family transporter [Actinopolymorpha pittospori]|uniref:Membrane protein YadS n=1 Tax=Actinopolymorpha pittospori TaxID=648752 RepID=A0A927RQD6_9ACTN|nr:putative membrane protein YadS [Actinopolymorpha pittospori]